MPARLSYPRKRESSNRRHMKWNRERPAYCIARSSRTMTAEFAATHPSSHPRSLSAGASGFRADPSVEQIEIDIAAAQNQADPLAANFCLVLQGGRQRRGAGALGKVMSIGPVGAYRSGNLGVGD